MKEYKKVFYDSRINNQFYIDNPKMAIPIKKPMVNHRAFAETGLLPFFKEPTEFLSVQKILQKRYIEKEIEIKSILNNSKSKTLKKTQKKTLKL